MESADPMLDTSLCFYQGLSLEISVSRTANSVELIDFLGCHPSIQARPSVLIDGWNPNLSYKVFAVRYKDFERSLKKTSEL